MSIKDELTKQQHIDVLTAYREVAPRCHTQKEAWEKTARHPAPRYYITPRQAWCRLRLMVRGDFSEVDNMKPIRKRMYYSLFEKLKEMSQKREFLGCSLYFICQFLVSEPAPEFFIGGDAVKRIFVFSKKYDVDFRYCKVARSKQKQQD